ncbi:MAG: LytTR family transcriptional regulator DNA-binding domain-containing protein [Bacteroidota bacterium]
MRILIIEDEARAANQLKQLLAALSFEYELLDQIDSIEESIQWLSTHQAPELIFMDIQLADGLSFEIFKHVEVTSPIIFTTAFDEYAIKAFKVNSIDYLLKPVREAELAQAIKKLESRQQNTHISPALMQSLLNSLQRPAQRSGVLVKEGNGHIHLRVQDIIYIYAEDGLCFVKTKAKRFILNETIDQFMATVDPRHFFKINRAQIVTRPAILRLEPYFNHRVKLSLVHANAVEFIVSRNRTPAFKAWLNS